MATAYPSTEDVKSYMRNEKPTEDDALYGEALEAAIQIMRDACQRPFVVAPTLIGSYTTRTFVPDGSDLLHVGDFTAASVVSENGTTLTVGTHYQLEPVATVNFAGLATSYNSIRRLGGYWYTNGPRGTVAVTAAWGEATIAARVIESVKIITKDIIDNREVKFGLIDVSDAGGVSARTNPIVRATIDKYRGPMSWGIA